MTVFWKFELSLEVLWVLYGDNTYLHSPTDPHDLWQYWECSQVGFWYIWAEHWAGFSYAIWRSVLNLKIGERTFSIWKCRHLCVFKPFCYKRTFKSHLKKTSHISIYDYFPVPDGVRQRCVLKLPLISACMDCVIFHVVTSRKCEVPFGEERFNDLGVGTG